MSELVLGWKTTLLNIFPLEFFPFKHLCPFILLDFGVR
jgi:hypothetical protein